MPRIALAIAAFLRGRIGAADSLAFLHTLQTSLSILQHFYIFLIIIKTSEEYINAKTAQVNLCTSRHTQR